MWPSTSTLLFCSSFSSNIKRGACTGPLVVKTNMFKKEFLKLYVEHSRLRSLGERKDMDITIDGFHSWMWKVIVNSCISMSPIIDSPLVAPILGYLPRRFSLIIQWLRVWYGCSPSFTLATSLRSTMHMPCTTSTFRWSSANLMGPWLSFCLVPWCNLARGCHVHSLPHAWAW